MHILKRSAWLQAAAGTALLLIVSSVTAYTFLHG
jgi:hypothetical protein